MELSPALCDDPRGEMEEQAGGRSKRDGVYATKELIHFIDVNTPCYFHSTKYHNNVQQLYSS